MNENALKTNNKNEQCLNALGWHYDSTDKEFWEEAVLWKERKIYRHTQTLVYELKQPLNAKVNPNDLIQNLCGNK